MSLRPRPSLPPVPDDTARVARAAFPRGNRYLLLRDSLGTVFVDTDFADLYPRLGQPAYAPWRLAPVTVMQFRESLSDRGAAEAVRARIDWKFLLSLDLADAGFDHSVLCGFRRRLLGGGAADRLLARVLDVAREGGLLRARGRQRTDSTHALAAIRTLNRAELMAETLRAALNAIAAVAPDRLRGIAPPDWRERYGRRIEIIRLPEIGPKRDAYVAQVGSDGFHLLDALAEADTPAALPLLPEVGAVRRVWGRHFERGAEDDDGGVGAARLRDLRGKGDNDRVESPYDTDARFRTRSGTCWTGHVVHLTETCDEGAPRLVVHADTTPANAHEAPRTAPIHAALAACGSPPAQHLVDSAYVSAPAIVSARERHGIDLIGPGRPDVTWQGRGGDAFTAADFAVDWGRGVVRCPEGKESFTWNTCATRNRQGTFVHVDFRAADCEPCTSRGRCTRARMKYVGRSLSLLPRPEHEALAAARSREETPEGRRLYALRQGIEGTMARAVRAFGLRRTRYRGLPKTALQHVATAAAPNIDRIAAWLAGRPLAPTRTSRFAALAA